VTLHTHTPAGGSVMVAGRALVVLRRPATDEALRRE
jgi:isoamylase